MQPAKYLAALVLLATCVAAKFADDPTFTLIWKPKESQSLAYSLSAEMSAAGQKFAFLADMTQKVTKIAENGDYTVETVINNNRLVEDGTETKVPDDEDAKPKIEKFNAKGELLDDPEAKGDDEDNSPLVSLSQMTNLGKPEKPVKKGDKWSKEFKAGKETPAAKADYEVVGVEKLGKFEIVKIKIVYKQTEGEHPLSAEGTLSFDVKDQSLVQFEALLDGLEGPEAGVTGNLKVKMVLKEAEAAG